MKPTRSLALLRALFCLAACLLICPVIVSAQEEEESEPPQPSIIDPGPDTSDFPDSAFTVKPGVVYFETSINYERAKDSLTRDYYTATLIRAGINDDLELRLSTPGIIHEDRAIDSSTGFGALTFGFKRHIWDEDKDTGIPAFGIIGQVTAPTATPGFDNGAAEPAVFFNFDHSITDDLDFEWNAGMTWIKADNGERKLQGNFLWSLSYDWSETFRTFWHGFLFTPSEAGDEQELLTGPGFFWAVTNRAGLDASYNFGLTPETPHRQIRIGFSVAF